MLGPAIGYIAGGFLLDVYTDFPSVDAGRYVVTFTTHRKSGVGSIRGWEYTYCNTPLLSRYENCCINMNIVRGSNLATVHPLAIILDLGQYGDLTALYHLLYVSYSITLVS